MTNYLLLRDNKQTGPYTFDELKEKGLKAYDLVWVEGKSAAWRYPCEIQELSPFAPKVEEQPFDRFYKKPAQLSSVQSLDNEKEGRSQHNNTSVTPAPVRASSNGAIAATILTGDASSSASPGRRIIYVTLPAVRTIPAASPAPRSVVEPQKDAIGAVEPRQETPAAVGLVDEDAGASVEINPHPRRKSRLGQTLLVGLTVMALLMAGIFIGLSLNKDSGIIKNFSVGNGKDKPAMTVDHPALAVNSIPPAPAKGNITGKDTTASAIPEKTAPVTTPKSVATRRSASLVQKPQTAAPAPKDSSLQVLPAAHRETAVRSDITTEKVDKDAVRSNISNLVSIGASGYTVGTFGGISNLQLTVSNRSIYSLDLVVVEVQYIQANKKVFKTENLYFHDIAPGSALMQEAPKSSRGIKVQYKITLVNSKELGLSYSAL
ncbi:MAG TPA: hypothetical protein VGM31_02035 [Puia sp.]|jgi:hypothetical protein